MQLRIDIIDLCDGTLNTEQVKHLLFYRDEEIEYEIQRLIDEDRIEIQADETLNILKEN